MNLALSKKDQCLLIGLFGVLFLLIAWLYVANPLKEKTVVLETENVTLQAKAELYQAINANLPKYEKEIEEMNQEIAKISAAYPVHVSREDEIMLLANMENQYHSDLAVENIVMSAVMEVMPKDSGEPAPAPTEEGGDATVTDTTGSSEIQTPDIHMYKQPTNYSFRCTYKGAKEMLNHLFALSDKKGVENLTLAYDSETGNLRGSLDLNQYYMIGIDKEYKAITIPSMPKGVDDVFHTINGAGIINNSNIQTQESEESDEAEDAEEEE